MVWWERLRRFEREAVDYPGTTYFVQSHHIREHSNPRRIEFIVIHITGGEILSNAVNTFIGSRERTRGASAHYIVDKDGTIVQMVRDHNIACHCANIGTAHNRLSIGIEHVCSPRSRITEPQYRNSAQLVRWLCHRYGIPIEHNTTRLTPGIRGHTEEYPSSTHGGCPNSVWDWDYYINLVRSS